MENGNVKGERRKRRERVTSTPTLTYNPTFKIWFYYPYVKNIIWCYFSFYPYFTL